MPNQNNLTFGRRIWQPHHNPAYGGQGSGGGSTLLKRPFWAPGFFVWPPPSLRARPRSCPEGGRGSFGCARVDPSGPDQDPAEGAPGDVRAQAAFIMAPSMPPPREENFQSATRSLRAGATIAFFLPRPPLRFTRSRNHRLNSDVGWCRSHNQASWIMVDRSPGLPDFDTPCSCCTDPLCHGVGASPA